MTMNCSNCLTKSKICCVTDMAERIDEIGFDGLKLIQDTEMFCYGVDAVLLAAFASRRHHESIVDLGTNNGVIPLMMSSMGNAPRIVGIEVQERACRLAERSVELNGLSGRIKIVNSDIMALDGLFSAGSFSCVVTNPPYMASGRGIENAKNLLTAARHETTASLSDFIEKAAWLLADRGYFYMIHRPSRIVDISVLCRQNRLEPKFLQLISPRKGEKPNLMLIECRKNAGRELKLLEPLWVYADNGGYSDEILRIYGRQHV